MSKTKSGSIMKIIHRDKYWENEKGELHREDGPAVEYTDGGKQWWVNGQVHREDGPAIETSYGYKEWYLNGQRHRIDGPACESSYGHKEWWIDGKKYTEEEFKKEVLKMNKAKDEPTEIDKNGTKIWRNEKGQYHREGGPAIEYAAGHKYWYVNGKLHRIDGPAVECTNGHKEWYLNGLLHREDSPAIEAASGNKSWWINGKRHRIDGPAIEYADGVKSWWVNGKQYTEEDFNKEILKMNKAKDEPTEINSDGTKIWRNKEGRLHREDGPAFEYADGSKVWWINGEIHRIDGPAYEGFNGYKEWYLNGERHRIDGPAIEDVNGAKFWYINDREYSLEEFNKIVNNNHETKEEVTMGIIDRISDNETVGIVKDSATTAVKLTLARQTSRFLADITRKILATGMEKAGYGDKTGILYTPIGDFIVELTIPMVIHSIAVNEKLPRYNAEIETASEWAIRANLSLYTMRFADQGADLLKASLSDKHIQSKIKELMGLGDAIKKAESGDTQALKNVTTPSVDFGLNLEEEDEENLGLHEVPGIALD